MRSSHRASLDETMTHHMSTARHLQSRPSDSSKYQNHASKHAQISPDSEQSNGSSLLHRSHFGHPEGVPNTGRTPIRNHRGQFQNLQWTAPSSRRQRDHNSDTSQKMIPQSAAIDDGDNPFRPSKALQVEDQVDTEIPHVVDQAPRQATRFSFAFKVKSGPAHAKPAQEFMKTDKNDMQHDNKNEVHETGGLKAGEQCPITAAHGSTADMIPEKALRRSTETKIIRRKRPERCISPGFADSRSVYYRKPGNESVVGSGTYGKVFKAIHVYTGSLAALKKIRMDGEKDGFPVTAVREIKLLQSLKHENVVSLREVMVEQNDCFMVFEYLAHDLTGLLNHPTFRLEHTYKKHLSEQLFKGLEYLHRRGVLHRDIKAANILISTNGQLKLADFGLARFYTKRGDADYTNRVITIWYRSPELLLGETRYGPAVDIWSAACVLIEIFTRQAIFPGDGGELSQLDKIYTVLGTPTKQEWPELVDMAWYELLRPLEKKTRSFSAKYKEHLTPAAFEMISAMLCYNPKARPTASEVLNHPYFTSELPNSKQALGLSEIQGEWHEFESKALRKEFERKQQDARNLNDKTQTMEETESQTARKRILGTTSNTDGSVKKRKNAN